MASLIQVAATNGPLRSPMIFNFLSVKLFKARTLRKMVFYVTDNQKLLVYFLRFAAFWIYIHVIFSLYVVVN